MRKKLPSLTVRADPTVMRGTFEIGRVAMPGLSPSGESPPAPRGVSHVDMPGRCIGGGA